MFFRPALAAAISLAASACADFPKDPEGTLERIRSEKAFRVGIVAPGADLPDLGKQKLLLARVAEATGAEPRIVRGASERLVAQLEKGELDLVIGEFAKDSPWHKRITMLPPLEKQKNEPGQTQLSVAARNGENGWIALLYRHGRAIAGGGG